MPDLLLEFFSEEIPARMQAKAADDLKALVTGRLVDAGLVYEGAKAFATPRRIALSVQGIPVRQPDLKDEKRGPRVGAPQAAIDGFLKSAGLAAIEEARIERDPKKGDFYVALVEKPGRPALDVLADMLPVIARTFPWPKSMRWGTASSKPGSLSWVRPLHAIVATFGPETEEPDIVPFSVDGIDAGDVTRGHRFLAPRAFKVRRLDDYMAKLEKHKVVLDAARRQEMILTDARTLAFAQGYELVEDAGLLAEVAGLVEWPVVLMGSFDEAFLGIPEEVIRATIRANQKCFVLRDAKTGKLANRFVLVANIEAQDGGRAIVAGNERVIRARLSDAKFFYETDLKTWRTVPLEERLKKFKSIVFHEKLGTQAERISRIERLAAKLAPLVGADVETTKRAARLCKADLVSEVVGEFPELQGLMGKYYALTAGEDESVARACEDHYKPVGPSDRVPTDPVLIAVALADKLDTLVGFWAIDEKPTGSKDPYALRRAALGVIRLVLSAGVRAKIGDFVRWSLLTYLSRTFRPEHGFRELAQDLDPTTQTKPQLKWWEAPYKNLLNYDGFVDTRGNSASLAQLGFPNFVPELNSEEAAEARSNLKELRDRLQKLDLLGNFIESDGSQVDEFRRLETSAEHREALDRFSELTFRDLLSFFADRLKVQLREQGARHDLVDAVFALEAQDDILLIVRRVEALGQFLDTDDGKNLLAGYKRATNIIRIEEKRDQTAYTGAPDPPLYRQAEEWELARAIDTARAEAGAAVVREDFTAAMRAMAKLRPHVDAFFDKVTVNAEDASVRANRLRLLNEIREATRAVADFSKIGG